MDKHQIGVNAGKVWKLLKAIKADHDTCHIPIILLSAQSSLDDRIASSNDSKKPEAYDNNYSHNRYLPLHR